MKERPILMATASVQAILNGPKTQTRRIIKIPKQGRIKSGYVCENGLFYNNKGYVRICFDTSGLADFESLYCPYGQVGDRLWVKETWATENQYNSLKPSQIPHSARIWYLADDSRPAWVGRTRSALFMCRWMSRILREITEIRAERVQDISEEDAIAEGIERHTDSGNNIFWFEVASDYHGDTQGVTAIEAFGKLWDSINAKRGHGWDKNDWVWPISFKEID